MELTEIAREVFSDDLYATKATGICIDSVDENVTVCSLLLNDIHRNAKGHVMGGVIFTLADFAFAIAANSNILAERLQGIESQLQWVSSSSTIHYLAPVKGNILKAITKPVRRGKTQALYQTIVTDSENRQVALATTSGTRTNT